MTISSPTTASGEVEPAWQDTTAEFKSLQGLDTFKNYVKAHPVLKAEPEFTGFERFTREGLALSRCTFHATPPKGQPADITVMLARENGAWKVERLMVE